jgi:hypothetical protein
MATVNWQISGDFMGNCSCDYLRCPCPTSNYTEQPNRGWCNICIVFRVERGHYGDVRLDDLSAAMVIHVPGAMADGNWSLGMIVDDRATPEQQQALVAIYSGQAGGPMAAASGWIGTFLGLEARPIRFHKEGKKYSVQVPDMVDCAAEGTAGANPDEPVYLDNLFHPANTRVALAKGLRHHLHAFGIDFDAGGPNFSAYTTFDWKS